MIEPTRASDERLELVSFPSGEETLDGLLYRPAGEARGGVLVFHGNTTNFYRGPSRFMAPRLVQAGYAVLAFNRRGHDILTTLPGKRPGGGAFQTAAEGMADNDRAAEFLAERGFDSPIVVGHSNGGMLGAQFAVDHPETRALVLMSAHAGGPLTYLRGCAAGEMGAADGDGLLEEARSMVEAGRGDELMLMPGWWFAITAHSLIDRHTNTPDLLENARRLTCPSLFVVGDLENPEIYPAEEFAHVAPGPATATIVPGCDHWYRGVEDSVADHIVSWLDQTV
jgi:pimeloyl-ACP methyl ester carboxylesterase